MESDVSFELREKGEKKSELTESKKRDQRYPSAPFALWRRQFVHS